MSTAGRLVTLVLVTPDGTLVGALPPFPVEAPWWPEAHDVVRGARERYGVDVIVLRLLEVDAEEAFGGSVTYLAEVAAPVVAARWNGKLAEHPLRQPWARPGGPSTDLAWAAAALREGGFGPVETAQQIRTWNLSSLWRLEADGRAIWLKVVPSFFAHEGALLERLQGGPVPTLIARSGGRSLLAEVPGTDQYEAETSLERLLEMVDVLIPLQREWTSRAEELLRLGLPDFRAGELIPAIADLFDRDISDVGAENRATLAAFLRDLASRMAALAATGLPDTLVHGDFIGGNFRGDGDSLILLDWGDSGVGHPLLDMAAFLERVPGEHAAAVRDHWHEAWRAAVPGSDPALAAQLIAPIAAARQALIYRRFLDAIEPSEHPYHRNDPALWLRKTAAIVRSSTA
ncbi:MAG: phosphotransferase family protein [Candidatus Limnocylindria bacterium]